MELAYAAVELAYAAGLLWLSCPVTATLGPGVAPPERIDLGDIVLRRWAAADRAARSEAITASLDHLRRWMTWAASVTPAQQQEFDEAVLAGWPTADGSFLFGIFDAGGRVLGTVGLHDRVTVGGLEIGYWCHMAHTGRGVITRAAGALTDVALTLPGVERIEIHCDVANVRSAAVPRRLGYRLERLEPRSDRAPADLGTTMCWVRTAAS